MFGLQLVVWALGQTDRSSSLMTALAFPLSLSLVSFLSSLFVVLDSLSQHGGPSGVQDNGADRGLQEAES